VGKRDPRIDAYITKAPDYAKPILTHIRDVVHAACAEVEEDLKWQSPSFQYKGMMCGMSAFKQYAAFGFWKHELVTGAPREAGSMGFGKLTKVSDLPSTKALTAYIKKAMALNDAGVNAPPNARKAPKPPVKAPADLVAALKKNKRAAATYDAFSTSAKREYVEWITDAKSDETRTKRITTAVEWMAEGKHRNWKYK
jgi:uncharacterized protein YdeI (YjbR/CyaY-like superfamily)